MGVAPKTAEITIEGYLNGEVAINKVYVECTGGVDATKLEELAGITATWMADDFLPGTGISYISNRIIAKDISVADGAVFINVDNQGDPGELANPVPNNVTFAIHRNTGFSGKKAKSRVYWAGLVQAHLASPTEIVEATANALVNVWDTLRTALEAGTGDTYTYGYVSRFLNGVERSPWLFVPVVGHSYTDLHLDSARRRLAGRGR